MEKGGRLRRRRLKAEEEVEGEAEVSEEEEETEGGGTGGACRGGGGGERGGGGTELPGGYTRATWSPAFRPPFSVSATATLSALLWSCRQEAELATAPWWTDAVLSHWSSLPTTSTHNSAETLNHSGVKI